MDLLGFMMELEIKQQCSTLSYLALKFLHKNDCYYNIFLEKRSCQLAEKITKTFFIV